MGGKLSTFIVIGGISLLFIILAIAIKFGHAYFLIAGYNTASKEEKTKIDIKYVANCLTVMLMLCVVCMVISAIFEFFDMSTASLVAMLFIIPVIFGGIIFSNLTDKKAQASLADKKAQANHNKSFIIAIVVFFLIILAVVTVSITASLAPNSISTSGSELYIRGEFGDTIDLSEIKSIQLQSIAPQTDYRKNGSAIGNMCKGVFVQKDGSERRIYADISKPPFIVLKLDPNDHPDVVIFNFKSSSQTKAFYNELKSKVKVS